MGGRQDLPVNVAVTSLCLCDSNPYLSCFDELVDSPSFYGCPVSFKIHKHAGTLFIYLLLRFSLISSPSHHSLTLSNPHLGLFGVR
ncbi:unnamed protein product [Hymenolepis diminuta]|uniref:Uncharacterized protein n=1 Tax=Hymenolepis diminuta TaxID=6216 RepID=A0A564Z096_HYMDI|nr:unnamed protein product [Hymenolepis diminuta]